MTKYGKGIDYDFSPYTKPDTHDVVNLLKVSLVGMLLIYRRCQGQL